MQNPNLYSPEVWNEFVEKFGKTKSQFRLKTYPQFDPFFNFFERHEEIHELIRDQALLKVAQHSFLPFVKILTKTPRYRYQEDAQCYNLDTKIRPISFASHFDSYIYAFYSFSLTKRYQCYIRSKGFDECVLAYRTDLDGKCNIQFAKEIFDDVRNRTSSGQHCTAIALDVSGYFDSIDHRVLKEKWCKVLGCEELPRDQFKVYKSLTKYSYVNKNSLLRHFGVDLKAMRLNGVRWQALTDLIPDDIAGKRFTQKFDLLRARKLITTNQPKVDGNGVTSYKGIPQGSPLSALLSNIYLVDFDEWAFDFSRQLGFTYRRYCDDLLILCESDQAAHINEEILKKIDEYHLVIQGRKTDLIEFRPDSKGVVRSFNRKKINQQNAILNDSNESKYFKNLQYLGFEFNGRNIYIRPGSLSKYFRKLKGRITKSVLMAYSKNAKADFIFKKQILAKYSHLGGRNFLTYAFNASKKQYENSKGVTRDGMDSKSIRRQISSHFTILTKEIDKTSRQRAFQKMKKGSVLIIKK